jgi:16S rRNA (uracil1498-N3)-methyltransferase
VRVPVADLTSGERTLDEAQSHYLLRVQRLAPGDSFQAFDPEAKLEAEARITGASGRRVRCRLAEPGPASVVAGFELWLLQAAGKGDKVDQVVRDATALGVTRLVIVESKRCVIRVGEKARERWRKVAVQAARQSGRGDVPRIEGPLGVARALELVPLAMRKLVCDPKSAVGLGAALREWRPATGAAFLIGPEGGLTTEEVELAERAGFIAVSLGPMILRTETAAVAALAACSARWAAEPSARETDLDLDASRSQDNG